MSTTVHAASRNGQKMWIVYEKDDKTSRTREYHVWLFEDGTPRMVVNETDRFNSRTVDAQGPTAKRLAVAIRREDPSWSQKFVVRKATERVYGRVYVVIDSTTSRTYRVTADTISFSDHIIGVSGKRLDMSSRTAKAIMAVIRKYERNT